MSEREDPKPEERAKVGFLPEEVHARTDAARAYRNLVGQLATQARYAIEILGEAMSLTVEGLREGAPEEEIPLKSDGTPSRAARRSSGDKHAALQLQVMRLRMGAATKTLQATRHFLGRGANGDSDAESEPEDDQALRELENSLS